MGIFCEDIREEIASTQTIVGVFPDNLNIPHVPIGLPKLCLYIRIAVDPFIDIDPMTIWLVTPDGQEQQVSAIDPSLVASTQAIVRASGTPMATLISRVIAAGFPVVAFGRLRAVLRTKDEEIVCATLNFQPTPITPSPTEKKSRARQSRATQAKKASKSEPSRASTPIRQRRRSSRKSRQA